MEDELQNKLERFLEQIEKAKDDRLYSPDMIKELVSAAQLEKINLRKEEIVSSP